MTNHEAILPRPNLLSFSLVWHWSGKRGWSRFPSVAVSITVEAEQSNHRLTVHAVSFSNDVPSLDNDAPWPEMSAHEKDRFRAMLRDELQQGVPSGIVVRSIPKEAIGG